ncbi:MAG: QueT transporter family protein [Coriobacteriia bacterium]|nr:QueT transporter family protein [Coriobacteriia bacterium]
MIAAVYGALTLLTVQFLGFLGWGPIQLRLSEAVTVVACLTPAAIPGLALGSVAANLFTFASSGNPLALLDVVFGSLGTLLGAMWTWRFRDRPRLALLGPVLANALIVPAYLPLLVKGLGLYKIPLLELNFEGKWLAMYLFGVVTIAIGEAIVVYGLGLPLLTGLRRLGLGEVLRGPAWRH